MLLYTNEPDMSASPTILLLQARNQDDPILEHELMCFVTRSGLSRAHFRAVNLVTTPRHDASLLQGVDVVMMGGSGDYSVVKAGYPWHESMLELMRIIVDRRLPMFASCFGFQALAMAMGSTLAADPAHAELGTWPMTLSPEGKSDPLFGKLPETFAAQLGHNDSVIRLAPGLTCLASSAACPVQAFRIPDTHIVATQFHPELTHRDNITRYLRYLEAYRQDDETMEEATERAEAMHRPSPEANSLIRLFLNSLQEHS
jgi:GMP synthase (glutamine-hydrolysing)